jgi:nucleotide-binding universal stress UspA family protein
MSPPERSPDVFARPVCGIDESPEGIDALRLLLRLAPADTEITAVGVLDVDLVVHAGWAATAVESEIERDLRANLDAAAGLDPRVRTRYVRGSLLPSLRAVLAEENATLAALGSHGLRRSAGIVLGSVMTTLLHEADHAVLVGRPLPDPDAPPRAIVVGVDGSPVSLEAVAVAGELARRLGVPLEGVMASGGKGVDEERARSAGVEIVADERRPVNALVEHGGDASLVVVGSRGLHGLRSLGSVSERVAHRARCPVLVVRGSAAEQ